MKKVIVTDSVGFDRFINEMVEAVQEYNRILDLYNRFECNLVKYLLTDSRADEEVLKMWQGIYKWATKPTDLDVQNDNKVCLITYLEQDWNAWFKSVLDGSFKYMNLTHIVWKSWLEH